jgi:Tfp pilus assembly protein PilV
MREERLSLSKKTQLGQTLIEVLTALAVVLLVIVALIRATTTSMKSSDFSKSQVLATRYGQEAIEWIRAERDKSWSNLSTHLSTYCLTSLSWSTGTCPYSLGGKFKREATLRDVGGNRIEVKVIVSWQDSSGEHKSELTTYLTNWR